MDFFFERLNERIALVVCQEFMVNVMKSENYSNDALVVVIVRLQMEQHSLELGTGTNRRFSRSFVAEEVTNVQEL